MEFFNDLPSYLKTIILTAITVTCAYTVFQLGVLLLRQVLKKWLNAHIVYPTFKSAWKLLVIVVASSVYLNNVVQIPTSTVLATIGISGVTIGVAAQGFIKDIIMGIVVLTSHSFQIGDIITVKNSITGRVDKLTLQNTQIVSEDGTRHFIANSEMTVVSVLTSQSNSA